MRLGRIIYGFLSFLQISLAFQPDAVALRKVFEDALARRQQMYGNADPRTAQAARDLGFFLKEAGETKAAAAAFTQALRIDQAAHGPNTRQALAGMVALASVSERSEAETLLRQALVSPGADAQLAVPALSTLGDLRQAAGDAAGAAGYWRLALRQAESLYGKDAVPVGKLLNSLAGVVDSGEAVELLERAADVARRVWGEQHPETATSELNLARALLRAQRAEEAADQARRSLRAFETTVGSLHPRVAVALLVLGEALLAQHHPAEAEASYTKALEIDRLTFGADDAETVLVARKLKALLRARGRTGQVLALERTYPALQK